MTEPTSREPFSKGAQGDPVRTPLTELSGGAIDERRTLHPFDELQTIAPEGASSEKSFVPSGPDLPGYTVLRELGRGGMGVVYLARHEKLARLVALKLLRAESDVEPHSLARFRVEAEAVPFRRSE